MSKIKDWLISLFESEQEVPTKLSDQQLNEVRAANRKLVSTLRKGTYVATMFSDVEILNSIKNNSKSWKAYQAYLEGWLCAKSQYSFGMVFSKDLLDIV